MPDGSQKHIDTRKGRKSKERREKETSGVFEEISRAPFYKEQGTMDGSGELTKLDLVQEAEALRRVISAYLNYASGAEEDVLRWERSYCKLRPEHKVLLRHLPLKYTQIRSCVEANMYLIHNMLQAFAPPFEMENFHFGGNESYQKVWNPDIGGVTEDKISQSNLPAREPGGQGDQSGISLSVPAPDVTKSPAVSCQDDGRADPRISNKRLASEISSGNGCLSDEEPVGYRPNNTRQQSALNPTDITPSTSHRRLGIIENGTRELEDWDPSVHAKRIACESNQKDSTAAVASASLNEDRPNDSTDDGCTGDMETGYGSVWFHPNFQLPVPPADVEKVRCIIRNIVRDWTEEGVTEREECYTPILKELEDLFPDRSRKRPPACLVPGAGLGRLAFEISRLGFETQGNEFSYYMMICSSFILNWTQEPLEWVIYPWIHSNCNTISDEDQLRPVRFPDLHPGSAEITEGFSMCAGDFVEVYRHPDQRETWDAVVTCFFIDTAHNVVDYVEIISRILKPGGIWVNLGPLLYHFADAHMCTSDDEMSVEICLNDVKRIAALYGLVLKKEKVINTTYSSNIKSMMQNRYYAAFWTMIKEENVMERGNSVSLEG
ncbi:hypothetical protein R1sor_018364 [Riccia sorocarpa]|uniref:carnosine N-methyltransferase n=1 Tax=Riccia sorocarpa TaxID=122646 RepID=A0ABD3IC73_9MARC